VHTDAVPASSDVTAVSVSTTPGGATGQNTAPTPPTRTFAVSLGSEVSY